MVCSVSSNADPKLWAFDSWWHGLDPDIGRRNHPDLCKFWVYFYLVNVNCLYGFCWQCTLEYYTASILSSYDASSWCTHYYSVVDIGSGSWKSMWQFCFPGLMLSRRLLWFKHNVKTHDKKLRELERVLESVACGHRFGETSLQSRFQFWSLLILV